LEEKLKAQGSKLKGEEAEEKLKAQGSRLKAVGEFKARGSEELSALSLEPSARAKRVPIIAMTAHAMAGDDQKSLAAGMDGHITKPIDPAQLFSTLLKWIKPRPATMKAITAGEGGGRISAHPAPVLGKEAFPSHMAGFDLEDGLKRLQGNEKLYSKLLINFAAKYADMAADILQAIKFLDFEQAHGMVHSLKGMAGNLAAVELQSAAIGLEKLVKHAHSEKPPASDELKLKFAILDAALNQAIQSIQTFWPPDQATPVAEEVGMPAAVPPVMAREAASRLRDAAEMGDVSGVVSIINDFESRSTAFRPYKDKIIQLADDFDFEGILKMAQEFRNHQ
jgi:CheY-like chemotaxis protein